MAFECLFAVFCLVKNISTYNIHIKNNFIFTPSDNFYPLNCNKSNNMGKGVSWSAKERECAALAWFRATNNATVGADQRMEDFQNKIFSIFKVLAPTNTPVRPGTYEHRTPSAVYSCLKDIFTDIGNFNKALTVINNSNPTGVNADNKISMAVALHTIKEVKRLDYNYRDYDYFKWVNYPAWQVLRHSPKYRPPSPPSTMNENDNTSPPAIDSVSMAESPFPPDSATTNAEIMQMATTNLNPSPPAAVAAASTVATSSAAVSHDNNLSSSTSSKKRAFVPADPALGGRGAEMGAKKAKKENDKIRAEEMKEKRFDELKEELREQTKTQKRLVRLFELRTLIKTAMMTKNNKLLKQANAEMAKFLSMNDSSPTDENDADDDDDDDDDDFPPTIPRAHV
jgi:hypothetical protein